MILKKDTPDVFQFKEGMKDNNFQPSAFLSQTNTTIRLPFCKTKTLIERDGNFLDLIENAGENDL
eukprot:CAMPEP_0197185300 /NCGR_PEP_ID=MMETSP1423-20130617/11650_1 /TAXON_ID=476441 /ORGANISM="Pseudo-nitzschia heimii, Strain UNC1101" /LENGTH=64 /DNA_ID=CAMNT_0042636325 /DNA_START=547 /DNA_END=741 /DNA_ORIENTATION=-